MSRRSDNLETYAPGADPGRDPEVAARYDEAADSYDRVVDRLSLGLDRRIRDELIRQLDPRPGERILELGAGTGRNLEFLDRAMEGQGEVVLVDISRGMLSRAEDRAAGLGIDVSLVRKDVREYAPPGEFDRVLSTYLLTTLTEFDLIVVRMARWVRPGGRVLIADDRLPPGWFLGPVPMLRGLLRRGYPDVYHRARRTLRRAFGEVSARSFFFGLIFSLRADRRDCTLTGFRRAE